MVELGSHDDESLYQACIGDDYIAQFVHNPSEIQNSETISEENKDDRSNSILILAKNFKPIDRDDDWR